MENQNLSNGPENGTDTKQALTNILKSSNIDTDDINTIKLLKIEDQQKLLELIKTNSNIIKEINDNSPLETSVLNNIISKAEVDEKAAKVDEKDTKIDNKAEIIKEAFTLSNDIKEKSGIDKNPNYKNWVENAKKDILKSNPELATDTPENQKKLEELAQILVVRDNKEQILKTHPELADKFTALETNVSKIKELENVRTNPSTTDYIISNSLPRSSADKIKDTITTNGPIKIEGDKLVGTSLDGITKEIYSVGPEGKVQKSIQKYGYTFDVGISPDINTDNKLETRALTKEIDKNRETIKSRNELFTSLPEKKEGQNLFNQSDLSNLVNNKLLPSNLQNSISKYSQTLGSIEGAREAQNIFGGEPTQKEKTDLEKLNQDLKNIEQTIMDQFINFYAETKTLTQTTDEKTKKLNNLIEQDGSLSINNKDKQKEHETIARQTLGILKNIGITSIPQNDFNSIMSKVNNNPASLGLDRQFKLETFFISSGGKSQPELVKDFINIINKVAGFDSNSKDPSKVGIDPNDSEKILNGNIGEKYSSISFINNLKLSLYGSINGNDLQDKKITDRLTGETDIKK